MIMNHSMKPLMKAQQQNQNILNLLELESTKEKQQQGLNQIYWEHSML